MKKLIVYDLNGTLAESKSSLDDEMASLLHDLLGVYGMADTRIGVARLDLPDSLPPQGGADPPEGIV